MAGLLIGFPLATHAAGIDCDKARSQVEHLICSDKAIGLRDNDLSNAYSQAMETGADPAAITRSQREWLKQRNQCANSACLQRSYDDRIAALKQIPPAGWKTYRDPGLGISFEYLANRQVKACPASEGKPCVAMIGRNMDNSDYLIEFTRVDGGLEEVATKEAGFEKNEDGHWMSTYGRGVPQAVESFEGHGWKGMHATITCGISDEAGFHAAGGDCYWAVMSDGKRSIVADTEGVVGTDEATMHSVQTLRFEP